MRGHEITTEIGEGPSRRLRSALVRAAGWLAVALMLALSSPGVRVDEVAALPPVAGPAPELHAP